MSRRRVLVAVSAVQLAAGIAGQVLALRRKMAFDIALLGWTGRPDRVRRDSLVLGTGVSAPATILAAQAVATARLAGGDTRAARVLGLLGATMTAGYLVERETRTALLPEGWDPAVTPVVVSGIALAAAMAGLGLGGRAAPHRARAPSRV